MDYSVTFILALAIISVSMCNCSNSIFTSINDTIKATPIFVSLPIGAIILGLGFYGYFLRPVSITKSFKNVDPGLTKDVQTLKNGIDSCYDSLEGVCDIKFPELCQKQFMQCIGSYANRNPTNFLRIK
jgi:hypothetical protein